MESGNIKRSAVIYIGSSAVYLKIAERRVGGRFHILEDLEHPLNLGRDTFTKGRISFEKASETCNIILGFLQLIKEYRIEKIKTVATTAIREAENKEYILNQIKVETGLDVDILDDNEEKKFIYKGVYRKTRDNFGFLDDDTLISYIGTGRLGVTLFYKKDIKFNQNIRVGSLKLSNLLGEIQEKTDKFYIVIEEYLSSFAYTLRSLLPVENIKNFMVSGKEVDLISNLCRAEKDEDFSYISRDKFNDLYERIKDKTVNQLINMFDISGREADILLPSMAIYKLLWSFTDAEKIIAPSVFLVDVLLYDILYPQEEMKLKEFIDTNTVLSARNIGEKYDYDREHAQKVEEFTLQIFDALKKVHGLGERERLLLQVATILHDVGKFVSLKRHYYHSYDVIRASDILGLNNRELEIAANIARYHSRKLPEKSRDLYFRLSTKSDLVLMAKLASILRLGDALDRGHGRKFSDIKVELIDHKLEITVSTNESIWLEDWTFKKKADLFEQVFGMKAELKKRRVL